MRSLLREADPPQRVAHWVPDFGSASMRPNKFTNGETRLDFEHPSCDRLCLAGPVRLHQGGGLHYLRAVQLPKHGRAASTPNRNRGVEFARDSPLEERVSSEPVSEVGFLGPGNTARFREVYG